MIVIFLSALNKGRGTAAPYSIIFNERVEYHSLAQTPQQ
jgi:hypothetical protein